VSEDDIIVRGHTEHEETRLLIQKMIDRQKRISDTLNVHIMDEKESYENKFYKKPWFLGACFTALMTFFSYNYKLYQFLDSIDDTKETTMQLNKDMLEYKEMLKDVHKDVRDFKKDLNSIKEAMNSHIIRDTQLYKLYTKKSAG